MVIFYSFYVVLNQWTKTSPENIYCHNLLLAGIDSTGARRFDHVNEKIYKWLINDI